MSIYTPNYPDLDELKRVAIHALRVNLMAGEARKLEAIFTTLHDRTSVLAAIRKAGFIVFE